MLNERNQIENGSILKKTEKRKKIAQMKLEFHYYSNDLI